MNANTLKSFVDKQWDESIVPAITDYIRIPNKSPLFDPQWREHGHMDKAVKLIADWCKAQPIKGLKLEVVQLEKRTPVIFMEIPGEVDDTILLYGHLDKQPEMTGWSEGLGPWTPVRRGDRLYGRGGADDGYAAFASLTAILGCQEQKAKRARWCQAVLTASFGGSLSSLASTQCFTSLKNPSECRMG